MIRALTLKADEFPTCASNRRKRKPPQKYRWAEGTLVGAGVLNVARLLAAVAHALSRGFGRAIAGEVTDFAAVVALLTLGAVAAHVAEAAA